MKKISLFSAAILLVSFLQVFTAGAAPITPVTGGGTNTSTKPSIGSLLVGANTTTTANSQYGVLGVGANGSVPVASSGAAYGIAWQATSTLGISTGSGTVGPSTSTYVAVFNASGTVIGYINLTFNASTGVFSAPSGTFSGTLGIGTSTTDSEVNVFYDATSTASTKYALKLGTLNLTSPSANGTYFALNGPSTFSGKLMDLQNNGTSIFTVDNSNSVVNGFNINSIHSLTSPHGIYISGSLASAKLCMNAIGGTSYPCIGTAGINANNNWEMTFGGHPGGVPGDDPTLNPLMVLTEQARLGVGTTTPTTTLSVVGTSTSDIFDVASFSGASYFHVASNGNTSIGTSTSPSLARVLVNGQLKYVMPVNATSTNGTTTITFSTAARQMQVLGTATTTLYISNTENGDSDALKLCQDGTGSRTVTWVASSTNTSSTIDWGNAGVPTLTTTAGGCDWFTFLTSPMNSNTASSVVSGFYGSNGYSN